MAETSIRPAQELIDEHPSRYDRGCRCDACRVSNAKKANAYYHANHERIRPLQTARAAAHRPKRMCGLCALVQADWKSKYCVACKLVRKHQEYARRQLKKRGPVEREASRVAAANYRQRHPDKVREANRLARTRPLYLQRQYGISIEQFDAMVTTQGGTCAICKRPSTALHVDHDHVVGSVRGLLCGQCNRAIGLFGDDSSRLSAAIRYLEGAHRA